MLRPYVPASLDAEQFRRPALGQRLQTSSSPQCRSPCDLVHQALFDADLARQVLDVRLGGEEAVGPPLHDEPVTPLGDDHPAGLPSRVEHDHVGPRVIQLPAGGQARQPGTHDSHRHVQPRAAAVSRTISASAPTSSGSSFKDVVRSSRTPSRSASSRYTTSTSYSTSTWSHTNPMGTMRNARWPWPASSVMTPPASGPSHGSGSDPPLCNGSRPRASSTRLANAAALLLEGTVEGGPST